jgi:hypothetical protein
VAGKIFENQQLANSNWQLVLFGLMAWVWDWVTQGPPKRHARATQASPKGQARIALWKSFVFSESMKIGRVGEWYRPGTCLTE